MKKTLAVMLILAVVGLLAAGCSCTRGSGYYTTSPCYSYDCAGGKCSDGKCVSSATDWACPYY